MKKWILILGVSFLSFSSFATDYTAGPQTCKNFEGIENDYRDYPEPDTKLRHAWCLIIKGNDVRIQDKNLVEEGLMMLRDLVDEEEDAENDEYEEYIVASYYYGLFYYTKGTLDNEVATKNLDKVEKHLTKIFEYIRDNPSYYVKYSEWETAHAIEMEVYSMLPVVYLQMHYLRLSGDFRVLSSEDGDTYSEYNKSATEYIDLAKQYSEVCENMEVKDDGFREATKLLKQVCTMQIERIEGIEEIEGLEEIQVERQKALEKCGENVSKEACREIYKLNTKFYKAYQAIADEANKILEAGGYLIYTGSSR